MRAGARRGVALRATLIVVALGLAGGAAAADALVLTDAAHHEIRLEQAPRRVVTQMPSLTEIVCALGECARLVATDRYSDWPASVRSLPKTGGLDDAAIEAIVSLKPDVVLLAHATRVTDRLRELGVRTFDVDTQSYADIARSIGLVGRLLGVPERANALAHDIAAAVDAVAATSAARLRGRPPSVYYEIDAGPYAAGPGSYIGELLARAGARNIVGPGLGPFPKLNPEYVVSRDPDVIFISEHESADLGGRPGWASLRAVREHRVCSFPPAVSETIMRPGPRVADGLRALADCLARVAP
jgi:iron complex transport system substrate-binding protein